MKPRRIGAEPAEFAERRRYEVKGDLFVPGLLIPHLRTDPSNEAFRRWKRYAQVREMDF